MSDSRFFYVESLKDILKNGVSLGTIKDQIKEDEKAFFNMLFMTTFRQLAFIKEEVLPLFVKKKIAKKQEVLEYVLYLGISEILFLDTPDYAVINSYVDVAKKKTDKFGGNFVNAVLRNVARKKDELLQNRKTKTFSKDFINILKQDYNEAEINEMEEFANIEPMLDLSFKPNKEIIFDDSVLLDFNTLRLPSNTKVKNLKGFDEGLFWVQDASSSLAVKMLDMDLTGKNVLDLCAAPGGKTAQLLSRGAKVTAVDISLDRLEKLKENIKRLKLDNILNIICSDALKLDLDEKFDIVLIDAPCSATGTFRRHPEIIHTKKFDDVKKMARLQSDILDKSLSFLKDDGILIYATCSLSKMEGEVQIKNFIKKHQEINIIPIKITGTKKMLTKEGFLRILPQHLKDFFGTDGFFVACLQRKN